MKKVYLQTFKKLVQFFADHLFQILKEVYLQILKKTMVNFLAYHLFQILKTYTYKSEKEPGPIFAHYLFQILKEVYLQILKKGSPIIC